MIQINGWPTPLGPSTPKGLDTDIMAQGTVVIVVDDDAALLKSVARLLAHHGIESRELDTIFGSQAHHIDSLHMVAAQVFVERRRKRQA